MLHASVVSQEQSAILALTQVFKYAIQGHFLGIFCILATMVLKPGDDLLEFLIQLTCLSVLVW